MNFERMTSIMHTVLKLGIYVTYANRPKPKKWLEMMKTGFKGVQTKIMFH